MKNQLLTRMACLTVLSAALAGAAHSQEAANYYYFGLSAGQSHSQLDQNATNTSLYGPASGASLQGSEQQDTAYKIFGGYQFNRNFALEGGYFNLGKFTYSSASGANTMQGTYEVEGLNLDLVGTVPMTERFSFFGRIGAAYAHTHDSFNGTGLLVPPANNPSKYDTNLKVGVGLQYDISPSMQLRGEAERYRINDAYDNRGDVNVFSLALVFPIGRKSEARPVAATPAPYVAPVVQEEPVPVAKAVPVVVVPAPLPPAPKVVQLSADSMFGFDKAVLGPNGKTTLDNFAKDTEGVKFDSISVEGNADRIGGAAYNEKLSLQRAEAVKNYLLTTPQLQNATISATGLGENNPVTKPGDCVGTKPTKALKACLQPDRRVDVKMSGVR
jgi:OOP family OmpA-OmpF porin